MQKSIFFICALFFCAVLAAPLKADEGSIPHIDARTFADIVVRAQKPVLIQFDASWCPYCRALQPRLEELAKARAGRLEIYRIDTDAEPQLTVQYEVRTLPTLVMFQNGEEISRSEGAPKGDGLDSWVSQTIGK